MGLFDALLDPQFRQDLGRGLLDAGNRGAVAGLLGAPIDLTTMAMRPFGYSSEKPVLGSEWIGQKMQDAGLVSANRNPLAEALAGVALPGAAAKAAPLAYQAEATALRNAMAPTPMNTATRGQAGAVLADSEAARLERMRQQGFEPGWWRGGKSVADGSYYTPDKKAAEEFATRHGANADVREYAISPGNQFDLARTYGPEDLTSLRDVLKNDYGSKYADELLSVPGDFLGGRAPGGHIYQAVEQLSGGNGNAALKAAGFDTLNAGQELVVLNRAGTVRDKNLARFDPNKRFSPDPFAAVAGGGVGLGLLNQAADDK